MLTKVEAPGCPRNPTSTSVMPLVIQGNNYYIIICNQSMYLLTEWEGWMGKYLVQGQGIWTNLTQSRSILSCTTIFVLSLIGKLRKGLSEHSMKGELYMR